MKEERLKKFNELDIEFFATSEKVHWTYEWVNGKTENCLDYDFDNKKYIYYKDRKKTKEYSNIYEAIDNIKIGKRTIRQALIETDFDFKQII